MRAQFKVQTRINVPRITRLWDTFKTANSRATVMRSIASAIRIDMMENARSRGAFFGTPWPALKYSTIYKRQAYGQFLVDDDTLSQPLDASAVAFGKTKMFGRSKNLTRLISKVRFEWNESRLWIGSNDKVFKFHHLGTTGPYTIEARKKNILAFPLPTDRTKAKYVFNKSRVGLPQARHEGDLLGGRVWQYFIGKRVLHPGVPARPMLPSAQKATETALRVIEWWLFGKKVERGWKRFHVGAEGVSISPSLGQSRGR